MDSAPNTTVTPAPPIALQDLAYILNKTESLWNEMRGCRIFITGGTGFFGTWLLESFIAANTALHLDAQALVLTRSPDRFRLHRPHLAASDSVELLAGDVRDFDFPDDEFRYVIHAATDSVPSVGTNQPQETLSTIVEGTRRCLEFAESHGTQKFLLTSSGAVYGPQPSSMTHMAEDYCGGPDPCRTSSVYGEGKRMAELLCAMSAARSGMECKIARCFAFVGPHLPLDAHFAVGNFIRDAIHGGPIRIQGDGTPTRSYLYAADLAIWLWIMLFKAPSMRPFNVGSGQQRSILAVAEAVACALCPNREIQVAQAVASGAPIHRYVPSVEAAKNELGLTEGVPLVEAIRRSAVWYGWTG